MHRNELQVQIELITNTNQELVQRLAESETAMNAILSSTSWRMTAPVRRMSKIMPSSFRRRVRRIVRGLWRIVTLKSTRRNRDIAQRTQQLGSSPLFDPAWYLAVNPDVGTTEISPEMHYAKFGGSEGRDPGPKFSIGLYIERHPDAVTFPGGPFFHALHHGVTFNSDVTQFALPPPRSTEEPETASAAIEARFPDLRPLPVYAAPKGRLRLTIVTDSIGGGSLYGGVGTALIFASLTARHLGASLRLVTRTEDSDISPVGDLLKISGIAWDQNMEYIFAPRQGSQGHDIPASDSDLFLTTSWWTTWSTKQSVRAERIAYLVQEDERMFYPLGDDHLRCTEMLSIPEMLYIVNSELLLGHFRSNNLLFDATAFEPSFPNALYYPLSKRKAPGEKRRFFFYARPNNARNLYWRGLEALTGAIEEGILDPSEWEFYFAGHGSGQFSLPRGAKPIVPGPMAWAEYADFVRTMDIGLSLMYTPHPSYPPLDLAASGSIVVTNRFGPKVHLDQYSPNIICSDLTVPALIAAIRQAVALSQDSKSRLERFERSGLQRDWSVSMASALDRLANWGGALT